MNGQLGKVNRWVEGLLTLMMLMAAANVAGLQMWVDDGVS